MINDKFGWRQRVDFVGRATQFYYGVAHGGEIDHGRHTGEVLQDNSTGRKGYFRARGCFRIPVCQRKNVFTRYIAAIFMAQQILQENFQGIGQAVYMAFRNGVEAKDFKSIATNCQL